MTGTLAGSNFTETSVKKYYSIAGQMVAMKTGAEVKYFLQDHLGSVVAVLDAVRGRFKGGDLSSSG